MAAKNAADAYRIVSTYLSRNVIGGRNKVKNKDRNAIDKLVGLDSNNKYVIAVDLLINAYYDIEKFVPDGEPIEKLYEYVETIYFS